MNLKQFIYSALLIVICGFAFSCITPKYIDIEVLKPAEVNYPYRINKLYILDSQRVAINPSFKTPYEFYKVYWDTFNVAIEKRLKESPLFEDAEVSVVDYSNLYKELQNISFNDRKNINVCFISPSLISDSSHNEVSYNYWFQKIDLIYALKLEFVNLAFMDENKKVYQIRDTVYWESPLYSFADVVNSANKDLYITLAETSAGSFAAKIAPFWVTEERVIYFNSNKFMKRGYNNFVENNLEAAIGNWQIVYEKGAQYLASSAAQNISVCYETMDSLNLANKWINYAAAISTNRQIWNYQVYLKKRLAESEILKSQLIQTRK